MDYLKTNAPFWKREESAGGTSWIEARHHDDDGSRALDQILMARARQTASKRGRTATEFPEGGRRRVADAARFRPLRGEPLCRGQTGVRARHHRSGGGGRVPGLRNPASASRPVRELCDRARDRGRSQTNSRRDRAPRYVRENPPPISSTRSTCAACRFMSTSARSCRAPSSANCWIRISQARAMKRTQPVR